LLSSWESSPAGKPAGRHFLVGALLMIANWPWTIFAVMPTNAVLMATSLDDANAGTRELIVRWNLLHSVRTILGGAATIAFLIALSSA